MTYDARDLLADITGEPDGCVDLPEPAKASAVIRPLAEAARIVGDHGMLRQLRLWAVLHGIDLQHGVSREPAPDVGQGCGLEQPMPLRQLVAQLRAAGQGQRADGSFASGLAAPDAGAVVRCAQLLGSIALALGTPRSCRIYVKAARAVEAAVGPRSDDATTARDATTVETAAGAPGATSR